MRKKIYDKNNDNKAKSNKINKAVASRLICCLLVASTSAVVLADSQAQGVSSASISTAQENSGLDPKYQNVKIQYYKNKIYLTIEGLGYNINSLSNIKELKLLVYDKENLPQTEVDFGTTHKKTVEKEIDKKYVTAEGQYKFKVKINDSSVNGGTPFYLSTPDGLLKDSLWNVTLVKTNSIEEEKAEKKQSGSTIPASPETGARPSAPAVPSEPNQGDNLMPPVSPSPSGPQEDQKQTEEMQSESEKIKKFKQDHQDILAKVEEYKKSKTVDNKQLQELDEQKLSEYADKLKAAIDAHGQLSYEDQGKYEIDPVSNLYNDIIKEQEKRKENGNGNGNSVQPPQQDPGMSNQNVAKDVKKAIRDEIEEISNNVNKLIEEKADILGEKRKIELIKELEEVKIKVLQSLEEAKLEDLDAELNEDKAEETKEKLLETFGDIVEKIDGIADATEELENIAKRKIEEIENSNQSKEGKDEAKRRVKEALQKSKEEINKAQTESSVNEEKEKGKKAINEIEIISDKKGDALTEEAKPEYDINDEDTLKKGLPTQKGNALTEDKKPEYDINDEDTLKKGLPTQKGDALTEDKKPEYDINDEDTLKKGLSTQNPQTGERINVVQYTFAMILSAMAFVVTLFRRKKEK
ncbi:MULTISPECIES: DUF1542 domain-containing protein [Helcococcus]|uniref:DUF1542 domain-containing protein n=1 Tax=Helcococcus bovis TaxID=3153252 RepID=A0ABW9F5S3_9FIRM